MTISSSSASPRARAPRRAGRDSGAAERREGQPTSRAWACPTSAPRKRSIWCCETIRGLISERGDAAKLWGSMVKQTIKRRQPGFNESFYGFGSFNELLEEAQARQLLELELDENPAATSSAA